MLAIGCFIAATLQAVNLVIKRTQMVNDLFIYLGKISLSMSALK